MVVIKIFDAKDTNFNTAGNIIIEPLYCHEIKKKSLNGWYIDVEIPINYKKYIEQDKLCVVQTKSKLNPQAFRIKDIEYTTNKIVFQAQHVMFDAEDYFLLDSRPTNQNGLNVLNYINGMTDKVSPFTIYSNVENISTAYFIRKNLLEAWSIIEERWGGVFDADNWNISFLTSVGNDKGETIYYGKNLEDMKIIEDWSGVCTKLYPVGKDEVMLADKYLESTTQYDIPYTRTIKFDTQLDDEEQTEENLLNELKTNAINYLQENCVPKVCYEINSNINQEMEIGDIIQVKHPLCNISTEVLEYENDLILRKIIKLVFGNYSKDVKKKFKAVTNTIEAIKEAVNKQQTTINNQTNLINSLNKNGYVYIDENEILLLDAIPKEKAKNVWRFGLAGIGFSSNGYEGPFEVAMTMDGQINADFITTGTMSVSRIEGLANFISETEKQIAEIEIEQGNITSRVSSLETTAENLQAQIDGSIQFWNGSEIPTASNYPANEWTTEADKNNHRADIYTVIEDVDGELKQGKSYRFDKVGDTWQWIELTDNELSAVQALATSKAKVFVTTPTVPYNVGDLWLNNGKLYRCKTAKDSNGSYSSSDWEIAVDYTDDTVAELAKTIANNAQSTADSAVEGVNNITNTQGEAEGKNIHIEDSAEEPFVDISLHGETSQKTRSGKNLLNLLKCSFSGCTLNSDNKSLTCNLNNQYFASIYLSGLNNWLLENKGKSITFSTGTPLSATTSIVIYGTRSNGSTYQEANETGTGKCSITIADDFTAISSIELRFNRKTSTFTDTSTVINYAMLELGAVATDYEEYGAMPSPDYPSEIENIEGRNKLNTANLSTAAPSTNISINNGVFTQVTADTKANLEWYLQGYNNSSFVDTLATTIKNTLGIVSLKFTKTSSFNALRFGLNGSQRNTMVYIPIDNLKDDKTYVISANITNATQGSVSWEDMQIEEGTVATPYVPYNSLEFKVEGKNLWDEKYLNGYYSSTGNFVSANNQICTENYIKVVPNETYWLGVYSYVLAICLYDKNQKFINRIIFTLSTKNGITYTTDDKTHYIKINFSDNYGDTYKNDIIIAKSSMHTDYEPYKSQVATFPLGKEKLMEGSYLADDGIHHSKKQRVFDGSDDEGWTQNGVNQGYGIVLSDVGGGDSHTVNKVLCDKLTPVTQAQIFEGIVENAVACIGGTTHKLYVRFDSSVTADIFKSKLAEDPITIEYPLISEEVVPYTEEQQEAWNKIKALMTYKNITNITSDAYAKVIYMRDNGLDVYETKQNAQKRYTETSEKLTEQKMTVDGVITQVSETNKRLTNDYLTAEQVNAELDTTKEDIEIIKQNQVTMEQTSKNLKIAIDTINNEGVTKVKTSMGYTFDDEGFKLNRSNAETGTIIDEAAVQVIDKTGASEQNLLYAGYVKEGNTNYPSYIGQTIVASANMIVQNYLVVPNSRFEEYTNPVLGGKGTGVFEV